jgi:hypothetical protein
MLLTARFDDALAYASALHRGDAADARRAPTSWVRATARAPVPAFRAAIDAPTPQVPKHCLPARFVFRE